MNNIQLNTRAGVLNRFYNSTSALNKHKVESLDTFIQSDLTRWVDSEVASVRLNRSPSKVETSLMDENKSICVYNTLQLLVTKFHFQIHDNNYDPKKDNQRILSEAKQVDQGFEEKVNNILNQLDNGHELAKDGVLYNLQNYVCHRDVDTFHEAYRSITGNLLTKSADKIMNYLEDRIQKSKKAMINTDITMEMIDNNIQKSINSQNSTDNDGYSSLLLFHQALTYKKENSYFLSSNTRAMLKKIDEYLNKKHTTPSLGESRANDSSFSTVKVNKSSLPIGASSDLFVENDTRENLVKVNKSSLPIGASSDLFVENDTRENLVEVNKSSLPIVASSDLLVENDTRENLVKLFTTKDIPRETATEIVDFILENLLIVVRDIMLKDKSADCDDTNASILLTSKFGAIVTAKIKEQLQTKPKIKREIGTIIASNPKYLNEVFNLLPSCEQIKQDYGQLIKQDASILVLDPVTVAHILEADNGRLTYEHILIKKDEKHSINYIVNTRNNYLEILNGLNLEDNLNENTILIKTLSVQSVPNLILRLSTLSYLRAYTLNSFFGKLGLAEGSYGFAFERSFQLDLATKTCIMQFIPKWNGTPLDNHHAYATASFNLKIPETLEMLGASNIADILTFNSLVIVEKDSNSDEEYLRLKQMFADERLKARDIRPKEENADTSHQPGKATSSGIIPGNAAKQNEENSKVSWHNGIPCTDAPLEITPEPEAPPRSNNKNAETTTTTTTFSSSTQPSAVARNNTTLPAMNKRFQSEINKFREKKKPVVAAKIAERAGQHYEQISNWKMAAKFYERAYDCYNDIKGIESKELKDQAIEKYINCIIAAAQTTTSTTLLTMGPDFQSNIDSLQKNNKPMVAAKLAERAGQYYERISDWKAAAGFYECAYYRYNDTPDTTLADLGNKAIEKFITCKIAAKLAVDVYLHDVPKYFDSFDSKTRVALYIKISDQLIIQANEPINAANQAYYYNLAGNALIDVANIYSRQLQYSDNITSKDKNEIQFKRDSNHANAIMLFQNAITVGKKAQDIKTTRSKICEIFLTRMKLSDQLEEIVTGLQHIVNSRNPTDEKVLIDALKILKDKLNSPNVDLDINKTSENILSLLASCSNNKEAYTLMIANIKTFITNSPNLELGRKLSSAMGVILLHKKDFASAASFYQLSVDKTHHRLQTEQNKEIREQFGRNIQYLNDKIFTLNEQARATSKF